MLPNRFKLLVLLLVMSSSHYSQCVKYYFRTYELLNKYIVQYKMTFNLYFPFTIQWLKSHGPLTGCFGRFGPHLCSSPQWIDFAPLSWRFHGFCFSLTTDSTPSTEHDNRLQKNLNKHEHCLKKNKKLLFHKLRKSWTFWGIFFLSTRLIHGHICWFNL